MSVLQGWEPSRVLHYFEEICSIPHGSGNTRQISDYLVSFAKDHNLEVLQDELNNVLIKKPATAGYEEAPTVLLQGHMDMVCEKRADVELDFTKDGLRLGVEGDYLHANGTTLGGDDGIAVAYGLALLEDTEHPHPALEVLITVDEEIGLLGADGFDCSVLKSQRLINLDSEEEGILWVGCAGGLSSYSRVPVSHVEREGVALRVTVDGLLGGHSGAEIDKGRASAVVLLGRLLYELSDRADFALAELSGGEKDNAIPRNASAVLVADRQELPVIQEYLKTFEVQIAQEYAGIESGITAAAEEQGEGAFTVLHPSGFARVLFFLRNIPFGVQKMSGTIEGLVETSMNPGIVKLGKQELLVIASIRSSVESARDDLAAKVRFLTEFLGGEFEIQGAYPAWEYREDSPLRDRMVEIYREMYQEEPKVAAIHAGLECGLFYKRIPGLDAVSIGPSMKDIHTSEERLDLVSTRRVWEYLLKVLEALKD